LPPKLVAGIFPQGVEIIPTPVPSIEAPEPVLLNTWKHHAGVLRFRIRETIAAGVSGLEMLAHEMVVIGAELMDLYTGALDPGAIGRQVIAQLQSSGHFELPAYRSWIKESLGYAVLALDDGCEWVLRLGSETGRYIHIHPGRWAPGTCRVRANVLKTAAMALAYCGIKGSDPTDIKVVNQVRQKYLALAPLGRDLRGDQGIGTIIELLRQE
jgi:hypothetical protein